MTETERVEQLLTAHDPPLRAIDNTEYLREIAEAADTETVERARARGRSWTRIAVALGVSRQAARQQFGQKSSV